MDIKRYRNLLEEDRVDSSPGIISSQDKSTEDGFHRLMLTRSNHEWQILKIPEAGTQLFRVVIFFNIDKLLICENCFDWYMRVAPINQYNEERLAISIDEVFENFFGGKSAETQQKVRDLVVCVVDQFFELPDTYTLP